MVNYFLFEIGCLLVALLQIILISNVFIKEKKNIKKYSEKILQIINIIDDDLNPKAAYRLGKLGEELQKNNDAQVKLAGVCLTNFDVKISDVDEKVKTSTDYKKALKENTRNLLIALRTDNKSKLIDTIFQYYFLIYKYPSLDDDEHSTMELKTFMFKCINTIPDKDVYNNIHKYSLFFSRGNDEWNYLKIRTTDIKLIFLYDFFKSSMEQFWMDYPYNFNNPINQLIINKKLKIFKNTCWKTLTEIDYNNKIKLYWIISALFKRNVKIITSLNEIENMNREIILKSRIPKKIIEITKKID